MEFTRGCSVVRSTPHLLKGPVKRHRRPTRSGSGEHRAAGTGPHLGSAAALYVRGRSLGGPDTHQALTPAGQNELPGHPGCAVGTEADGRPGDEAQPCPGGGHVQSRCRTGWAGRHGRVSAGGGSIRRVTAASRQCHTDSQSRPSGSRTLHELVSRSPGTWTKNPRENTQTPPIRALGAVRGRDQGSYFFLPWFLTASIAAAAASGSRYVPPALTGLKDASSS